MIEAERRSPDLAAARADIAAARGRLEQAGLRYNPQLSVELENFGGSGALRGFRTTETTVSVNQQIDLAGHRGARVRSEEHTSELQSLMRISYAVFCLKKKTNKKRQNNIYNHTTKNTNQQDT